MPRKPTTYLLVSLPLIVGGGIGTYLASLWMFSYLRQIPKDEIPALNEFLITLPSSFLWLPIALWLSNFVIFATPPLRKLAAGYVARVRQPNFQDSQAALARAIRWTAAICVPLIVGGFVL